MDGARYQASDALHRPETNGVQGFGESTLWTLLQKLAYSSVLDAQGHHSHPAQR
jgi:hypothetical protein